MTDTTHLPYLLYAEVIGKAIEVVNGSTKKTTKPLPICQRTISANLQTKLDSSVISAASITTSAFTTASAVEAVWISTVTIASKRVADIKAWDRTRSDLIYDALRLRLLSSKQFQRLFLFTQRIDRMLHFSLFHDHRKRSEFAEIEHQFLQTRY